MAAQGLEAHAGCVALEARDITKRYFRKGRSQGHDFDAVSRASVTLAAGEMVAVMGRSGGGKSTLLNMLAGLLAPDEGQVLLSGQDLYALPDGELSRLRNARIGVVPQGQTPIHSLTVLQNVTLPHVMYHDPDPLAEQRAIGLLSRLGIEQLLDSYPSELSGGELRRMAIARALVNEPEVILADEPTSDLDDESTGVVLSCLHDQALAGAAVLVVTHDREAEAFCGRVLRMDSGRLI